MFTSHDNETIIAQATPIGVGAIALLRITGPQALEQVAPMARLASGIPLTAVASHTIHYGWVTRLDGSDLDQVMFIVMHAPKTFTGQHCIEITTHNNQFIIEAIIERALSCGIRLATAGEFSKRAVLNGKIDLLKAEAINDVIHANTQLTLKKSMEQLQGSLSHWITVLEKKLLKALALSEASFEFIDEEITFDKEIIALIAEVQQSLIAIKKTFNMQNQIRQGIRIALVGSVNAGKSSLFNALLNQDRSIVTDIAGTTRDSIEAGIYTKNSYLTLIDTAGLRQTDDIIEQEGIARSFRQAALADIIICVIDGSRILTEQENKLYNDCIAQYQDKTIVIQTKTDLSAAPITLHKKPDLAVSSVTGHNIEELHSLLEAKIANLFDSTTPFLLNKRQLTLLIAFEQKLSEIQSLAVAPIAYELLSYHITDALAQLGELTGKTISEQGMDAVFREFCVGK